MSGLATVRAHIEATVRDRARHASRDEALTTLSLARTEQLLEREYHGRYLIELLQNAADAWRFGDSSDELTDVVIIIEREDPSLVVANRGATFPAEVILDSIGQVGQSTKRSGEAIGHKGIGFKSVLEVSPAPEVYSGLAGETPHLALRFDSESALKLVREATPEWDRWLSGESKYEGDSRRSIPVLRYPTWIDDPPAIVRELASQGYETVVRLPFRGARQELQGWVRKLQDAHSQISDQTLLLLGCFRRVILRDYWSERAEQEREVVLDIGESTTVRPGITRERVQIARDGHPTSRWWLYRSATIRSGSLSDEIVVGVRTSVSPGNADGRVDTPVHAQDGEPSLGEMVPSAPFHLFFPTTIGSGLPFLLHGYFEVDASRKGFFAGSDDTNDAILDRLAALTVDAVVDLADNYMVDMIAMVDLVATCEVPEAPQARRFRDEVITRLDDAAWIPTLLDDEQPQHGRPEELLVATRQVIERVVATFPPSYVWYRVRLRVPSPRLSAIAFEFLMRRQSTLDPFWDAMRLILRPGALVSPFRPGPRQENDAFVELLALVKTLGHFDEGRADILIEELAGDPDAQLIPIPNVDGTNTRFAVPKYGPSEGRRRSVMIMARPAREILPEHLEQEDPMLEPESAEVVPLNPPDILDVRFLANGLLTANQIEDQPARRLGIRQFTVANVLDRLRVIPEAIDVDWRQLVTFLWELLDTPGKFGTREGSKHAQHFLPARWFWLEPGRGRGSERTEQDYLRFLSGVRLPNRLGDWVPAGSLAFGAEWAQWVEENLTTSDQTLRTASLRRLERIKPGDHVMLASPAEIMGLLTFRPPPRGSSGSSNTLPNSNGISEGASDDQARIALAQYAFLLRAGCWEVPPVEGHEVRQASGEGSAWPWPEVRNELGVQDEGAWNFSARSQGGPIWQGDGHSNVTVTEDFRLVWPLVADTSEGQEDIAAALASGASLYRQLVWAAALCWSCVAANGSRHSHPYFTHDHERRPSTLIHQLRRTTWVPAWLGRDDPAPVRPTEAWWHSSPPHESRILTSPFRHLRLARSATNWSPEFRELCGLTSLEEADATKLRDLHDQLKEDVTGRPPRIDLSNGNARNTFLGLIRLIYEELQGRGGTVDAVLCEVGPNLKYVPPSECRHDDGRYRGFKRLFAGRVPFVVLQQDKAAVAKALGIDRFEVAVSRRDEGTDDGVDVTRQLQRELTDRVPELLAIMVHHSASGTPLDPNGPEFPRRARSLQELRVRKVNDLVLDLAVVGFEGIQDRVGSGTRDEVYLDNRPETSVPILYHDLESTDWPTRIRSRLADPLAALAEAPAYADTFRLLLTADELDREELLRNWGISASDVSALRNQVGVVTEDEALHHRRWYAAVISAKTGMSAAPDRIPLESENELVDCLRGAGFGESDARRLAGAGGWQDVRDDTQSDSVLATLVRSGVALRSLSDLLASLDEPRLRINIAAQRFHAWSRAHEQRVVAALSFRGWARDDSIGRIGGLRVPEVCEFELAPHPGVLLMPWVDLLGEAGIAVTGEALANQAPEALANAAGVSVGDLERRAEVLYDPEARAARLRDLASDWLAEMTHLALLERVSGQTPSTVRGEAESLSKQFPPVSTPTGLRPYLGLLLPNHAGLVSTLSSLLSDELPGDQPDRREVWALARRAGINFTDADSQEILSALTARRRQRVQVISRQLAILREAKVAITPPPGLTPVESVGSVKSSGRKSIAAVKVTAATERRKKELGDDAESWALTAAIDTMQSLSVGQRVLAIESILEMLDRYQFDGAAVEKCRELAMRAKAIAIDDDDLIDRLQEFLHVSQYSDHFGFDLLGWIPIDGGESGRPMAIEVKHSTDGSFFLSKGEWQRAKELSEDEERPAAYAVLTVRRGKGTDPPTSLDLLVDPVRLAGSEQVDALNLLDADGDGSASDVLLKLTPDTFRARYRAARLTST